MLFFVLFYFCSQVPKPFIIRVPFRALQGILVDNMCLISIGNSVSDGATSKSVLNIEKKKRAKYFIRY